MNKSTTWLWLRIAELVIVAIISPWFYWQMYKEFEGQRPTLGFVLVLLSVSVVLVLFPLGIQRINPDSKSQWTRPSWRASPLNINQPIQMAYDAGWTFIVLGVSLAIYAVWLGSSNFMFVLPMTAGVGILLGVKLSTYLFRDRLIDSD